MRAIEAITADPALHTRDLGGNATTAEVTRAACASSRRPRIRTSARRDADARTTGGTTMPKLLAALLMAAFAPLAAAQVTCPDKNVLYWQAFPPGGESDLSARHQQVVLKAKCPAIDTIIQYKAGAGGGLMWSQMNQFRPTA
jgi:hypothetical protein